MSHQIIWLWTDVIFWLLCAGALAFCFLPKPEYIRVAWHHVGCSKVAMATGVVMLCYIGVALLDSIHYKSIVDYATSDQAFRTDVRTPLDHILSPIDLNLEKTYSAPFADHSFVAMPEGVDGNIIWTKAPLVTVSPDSYLKIPFLVFKGIFIGVIAWLILQGFMVYAFAKGDYDLYREWLTPHRKGVKWRAAAISALICFIVISLLLTLSQYFHVLGTDKIGQDVLYQSLKSIRTGVIIGTVTTLVLLPFAIFFGTLAGYARGWIDDGIQYIYTTLSSIPSVLLIAASVLMMQVIISRHPSIFESIPKRADLRLLALCVILGVTSWTSLCRLIRAETLKLRENDYVLASISLGASRGMIIRTHILPNLMHIVFITVALDFSALILTEAVLSYIGVGVDQSMHSWGNMINAARLELSRDPVVWWSILAAFLFMALLVLSANLFSDVVQKAFDPRAREGR